jgi:hypothetical protein
MTRPCDFVEREESIFASITSPSGLETSNQNVVSFPVPLLATHPAIASPISGSPDFARLLLVRAT